MYKPTTTAGKGVKWEWLSATTAEWNLYNMDVQNIVEDAWTKVSVFFFARSMIPLFPTVNFHSTSSVLIWRDLVQFSSGDIFPFPRFTSFE